MLETRIRALLIEDDVGDATLFGRVIAKLSAPCVDLHVCTTPADGVAALSKESFDVVFVDYYLGVESGVEVLAKIRAVDDSCAVVMVSGRGDESLAVEAMQAGASDYIPKAAISETTMRRVLVNALEKRTLRQKVRDHRQRLERSNADLERKNRELLSFYHTVSHELKTPLTAIREFVSIVCDGLAGSVSDEQREHLSTALESCNDLARTINDLLDATRLETGKLSLVKERTDVSGVLSRVVDGLASTAAAAGVRLSLDVDPAVTELDLDPQRFAQIARNLVTNALKFTEPGGRVEVSAAMERLDGPRLRVTVDDTGRGIEPAHLKKIFDRLYQVREDDYATGSGLGLGLSICKELVTLHGGSITATSEPGVGSRFSLWIPAESATTSVPRTTEAVP